MTTIDVSLNEKWVIRSALQRLRQSTARQRAISECNLADGVADVDVVTRLALHEELELATIDGLVKKLSYQAETARKKRRDGATIYQSHAEYPVTEMERDMFVTIIAVIRATRSGTPWPFAGIGITDAGPSPYGWLWDDTGELTKAD